MCSKLSTFECRLNLGEEEPKSHRFMLVSRPTWLSLVVEKRVQTGSVK